MSFLTLPQVPDTMTAAYLKRPMEVVTEKVPVPAIGPGEALVRVMAVGVCGSDVHYYEHGRIGRYIVESPLILGHECAGIVVAVGENTSIIQIGDRVAVEPGVPCSKCDLCKEGRYNLCRAVRFLATPPVDGAFAQYIAVREDFLFPIPDLLTYEEAALNEPLSVGIHAARRTGMRPGASVAILGMGPVGLMAVVAAKAFGARSITVTDLEPLRLQAALKLGANHAVNVKEQDPIREIKKYNGGSGVDVAFETAGNPKALQTALLSLKPGGKLAVIGLPQQDAVPLNVPFMADNEVEIFGVFRYANTYKRGIEILSSGIADVKSLITDRYPLEQTQAALEKARTGKTNSLKVMVYPNGLV